MKFIPDITIISISSFGSGFALLGEGIIDGEIGLIERLATLGIGGLLAVLVLVWKKQDDIKYQKALDSYANEFKEMTKTVIGVVEKSTSMQEKFASSIERLINKINIEELIEKKLNNK